MFLRGHSFLGVLTLPRIGNRNRFCPAVRRLRRRLLLSVYNIRTKNATVRHSPCPSSFGKAACSRSGSFPLTRRKTRAISEAADARKKSSAGTKTDHAAGSLSRDAVSATDNTAANICVMYQNTMHTMRPRALYSFVSTRKKRIAAISQNTESPTSTSANKMKITITTAMAMLPANAPNTPAMVPSPCTVKRKCSIENRQRPTANKTPRTIAVRSSAKQSLRPFCCRFIFSPYRSEFERRDLVHIIVEPVCIKQIGRARPRHAHFAARFIGKIVVRRTDGQSLGDVPLVFTAKGVAVILHVPRQKDLFVVLGFCDGQTRRIRFAQHDEIADALHILEVHRGVAGMRDVKDIVNAFEKRIVLFDALAVRKHAEQFFGKQIFLDAVMIIQRRLRTPADVNGAGDVPIRKIEDLFQFIPIQHLFEGHGLHGRTRDDHAVEVLILDLLERFIELFQMRRGGVLALVRFGVHEGDVHLQRRIGEKAHELGLRFHLGGHEIKNGDLQWTDVLRERALVAHDEDVFALQCRICGDIFGNDDRHCFLSFA